MPYVLKANVKDLVEAGFASGSIVRIVSISPGRDQCSVVESRSNKKGEEISSGYIRSLMTSNLEAFRAEQCSSWPKGMWFRNKVEAEAWVIVLGNSSGKGFVLSDTVRMKSGVLIALDEYTDKEASELMRLLNEWQTTPSAKKLVLNGNFKFIETNKIDDVEFERRKFDIAHQDRLNLVVENILKDD